MEKINIADLTELELFARRVIEQLLGTSTTKATVLALSGDLGAGKTTFVQALARTLGVKEVVQSPTFTIFKVYPLKNSEFIQLVHMDAYRIEDLSELGPLHFNEILESPRTLFCIEWAEKISSDLPPHISLKFDHTNDGGRLVGLEGITIAKA